MSNKTLAAEYEIYIKAYLLILSGETRLPRDVSQDDLDAATSPVFARHAMALGYCHGKMLHEPLTVGDFVEYMENGAVE